MRNVLVFLFLLFAGLTAQNPTYTQAVDAFSKNHFTQARQLIHRFLQQHPDDPAALNLLGNIYLSTQNYTKAIQIFQKLQNLTPHDASIALNLGKALEKNGQYTQALSQYQQAVQDSALTQIAQVLMAQLYFKQNQFSRALALYQQLIKRSPTNSYFHKQAARCLLKQSPISPQAENHLHKALQLNHKDLDVYILLFNLYKKKEAWAQALQTIQQGLLHYPHNTQLLIAAGDAYFASQKYFKAITQYKNALQAGDSSAYLFKKLGASYYYTNNFPSALLALKKSIRKDQQDPIPFYFLGLTQKALALPKKAIVSFEQAIRLSLPSYLPDIYFHLAESYQRQKVYSKAIAMYKKVLEMDSTQIMPLFYLATIYDQYYKDRQVPLRYYQQFLEKANETVAQRYKDYALERLQAIREQLHFQKGRKKQK